MKKLICKSYITFILVGFFGVFSLNTYAESFPDIDESSGYVAEVNFLAENGIIVGDNNGNFSPDDKITRAEFATILCRAIGIEEQANTEEIKNKVYYDDVPSDHWAAGYVNAATDSGAILGMGNRIFQPESPVTNEQIIKMLVAAWGYDEEADELGGYPNGYMAVADRYGVLDAISFNYGNASKRWVASIFVYGVLEKLPVSDNAKIKPKPPVIPNSDAVSERPPLSERVGTYIQDPMSLLNKVTKESAKYEETSFTQSVSVKKLIPFEVLESHLICTIPLKEGEISFSITNPNTKDAPLIEGIFVDCEESFDLSALPVGEWDFNSRFVNGAVEDKYSFTLIKRDGKGALEFGEFEFLGVHRSTNLNVVRQLSEVQHKLNLYNDVTNDAFPFNIRTSKNQDGNILLYIDYPKILDDKQAIQYNCFIYEGEDATDSEIIQFDAIDGENQKINPIIIPNLNIDTQYFLDIGWYSGDGEQITTKGILKFKKIGDNVNFQFDCEVVNQTTANYAIVNYQS